MTDDNFQLVTVAQLIAANNWLSHDTEDFIGAARTITNQILAPVEAERKAARAQAKGFSEIATAITEQHDALKARIDAALAELDRCAIEGYWSGTLVARIRAALTGEEEQ